MDQVAHIVDLALPTIDQDVKNQVLQKLDDLGADTPENLLFVDYKELCPPLKHCHARKLVSYRISANESLMSETSSQSDPFERESMLLESSFQPSCSKTSTPKATPKKRSIDELDISSIRFNASTTDFLQNERQITGTRDKVLRNIINTVVDFVIMNYSNKPTLQTWRVVAHKIMALHPASFKARIVELTEVHNDQIPLFEEILSTLMRNRFDNSSRSSKKRKAANQNLPDKDTTKKSQGCPNWDRTLNADEKKELEEIKGNMLEKYQQMGPTAEDDVRKKMLIAFFLVRNDINDNKKTLPDIFAEWPQMKNVQILQDHMNKLTGTYFLELNVRFFYYFSRLANNTF